MNSYDRFVDQLGKALLAAGLSKWKHKGDVSRDIFLALAKVNMPMSRARLRNTCSDAPDLFFEDALNDLIGLRVVWGCVTCPATKICEAKPRDEHYCLVEGVRILDELKRAGLSSFSQEEEEIFLNILRTVSHHGVDSVDEVSGTWPTIEYSVTPEDNEREFVQVPDKEFQAWTCDMLQRATKFIRIASEYGGWVAKEPFRSIITSKIKDGVDVTLVVNAPSAIGTNGRLEWNEWNKRHRKMGVSPIKRVWPDWERGGTSFNMTIVDGTSGKEVLFFERDRYGLTLAGVLYSRHPTRIVFCESKFEEYEKMMTLKERIRKVELEHVIFLVAGIVSAVISGALGTIGGIVGAIVGAVVGFIVGLILPYLIWKAYKWVIEYFRRR